VGKGGGGINRKSEKTSETILSNPVKEVVSKILEDDKV